MTVLMNSSSSSPSVNQGPPVARSDGRSEERMYILRVGCSTDFISEIMLRALRCLMADWKMESWRLVFILMVLDHAPSEAASSMRA